MSNRPGSTPKWRRMRVFVLQRDGERCQLQIPGVCIGVAPVSGRKPTDPGDGPPSGHMHHRHGYKVTGNALDPEYYEAACAPCNLKAGDPTKAPDPPCRPLTRW